MLKFLLKYKSENEDPPSPQPEPEPPASPTPPLLHPPPEPPTHTPNLSTHTLPPTPNQLDSTTFTPTPRIPNPNPQALQQHLKRKKNHRNPGMINTTAEPMSHPCAPPSALMQSPAKINNKHQWYNPQLSILPTPSHPSPSRRSNIQRFVSVSSGQASLTKFCKFCDICNFFAEISRKLLFFQTDFLRKF